MIEDKIGRMISDTVEIPVRMSATDPHDFGGYPSTPDSIPGSRTEAEQDAIDAAVREQFGQATEASVQSAYDKIDWMRDHGGNSFEIDDIVKRLRQLDERQLRRACVPLLDDVSGDPKSIINMVKFKLEQCQNQLKGLPVKQAPSVATQG